MFLGSPGLLLGFSWAAWALRELSGCSWLLLGLSCDEFAGTKENHENDDPHDKLGSTNLSHSEFSGTPGGFGKLGMRDKNRIGQISSNSDG